MKPDIKLKRISGIYKITNTLNGKVYIGQTICLWRRCHCYGYGFRKQKSKYINSHMLNSMNKYGFDNFKFEVVEFCEPDKLSIRELFWMTSYDSLNSSRGYNLRMDVNGKLVIKDSTRSKISERLRKEWECGVRSGHSKKLKDGWLNRDREQQGERFRKALTKYMYDAYYDGELVFSFTYRELMKHPLKGAIHRLRRLPPGENTVEYEGGYVTKRLL